VSQDKATRAVGEPGRHPGAPLRVLLLVQRPEAWVNLASLWLAMRDGNAFSSEVWVLPYSIENPAVSQQKLPLMRAVLASDGIPFHEWAQGEVVSPGQFDVVVLNHPYDRDRPRQLWVDRLKQVIPIMLYIPYGLVMAGGRKNLKLQFSQPTQIQATAVIARSEHEKSLYRRHCPRGDGHVHVLGQPRFDHLMEALSRPVPGWLSDAIGGRCAILWNSHFSFGKSCSHGGNFSTFDLLGPELLELVISRREQLCLIWRPHPGLFPAIVAEGLLDQDEVSTLREELAALGMVLDESADHADAFNASDALLTDVGSFLLEYLATGKPILSLVNVEGEPFNEEASRLVAHYARASTSAEVAGFIHLVQSGAVDVTGLEHALADHLPMLDGFAGQRVAQLMLELCGEVSSSARPSRTERGAMKVDRKLGDVRMKPGGTNSPTCIPPVLDKLMVGLRSLRAEKAEQPGWEKAVRRRLNGLRVSLGEGVKRHPGLMDLARRLGKR
jgi:hypothetical protein